MVAGKKDESIKNLNGTRRVDIIMNKLKINMKIPIPIKTNKKNFYADFEY